MKKIYIFIFIIFCLFLFSCGKKNICTIKLNGIIGVENSNIQTEYKLKKGESLNLPDLKSGSDSEIDYVTQTDELVITRTDIDYSFLGWSTKISDDISNPYKVEKSLDLYANFYTNAIETKITYVLNGGYIDSSSLDLDLEGMVKLEVPSRAEYIFVGWAKNSSLLGNIYDEIDITLGEEYKFYAKYSYDPAILVKYIDQLPDTLTIDDVSFVSYIREKYDEVSPSNKSYVTNYDKFVELEAQALELEDVITVVDLIDDLSSIDKKLAGNIKEVNEIEYLYSELPTEKQSLVKNYDTYISIKDEVLVLYNTYKDEAFEFDKSICIIPSYVGLNAQSLIINVYDQYLDLDENIKSLLVCSDKIELLYKELQKELSSSKIHFITAIGDNLNIYTTKENLFKGFFTDFYFYICLYHGDQELVKDKKYNVTDFVNLAADFNGDGVSNCYGIGNLAGRYMLVKDINGILENQPETGFLGFCYKNGLYDDIIPFLINFFAYWRLDEKYASLSNYGADTFAESWAPTVDFAKFFYYDENTSYVKTERMLDCFNNIAGVCYGIDGCKSIPSYVKLRGYVFEGWYDNKEFSGEAITSVDYSTIDNLVLYAKYSIDNYQQDKDSAEFVNNYIYNLTTSAAQVNSVTVGYVVTMYNNLSANAKKLVTKYSTLLELKSKYC